MLYLLFATQADMLSMPHSLSGLRLGCLPGLPFAFSTCITGYPRAELCWGTNYFLLTCIWKMCWEGVKALACWLDCNQWLPLSPEHETSGFHVIGVQCSRAWKICHPLLCIHFSIPTCPSILSSSTVSQKAFTIPSWFSLSYSHIT
jgi:hypothetical protein